MSRSIHITYRGLAMLKRKKFASAEAKTEAIAKAESDLRRKSRIKRLVVVERRLSSPVGEPTNVHSIPIWVKDSGPYVHHAIAEHDIRAILAALPAQAVRGIDEIRLALGRERMAERSDDLGGDPDPYTGRLGAELFPGVHGGRVLGTYNPSRGLITVYAYVVDPRRLEMPRALCDLFLRLQALKTFVHEVAHFHDHVARVRRGRWRADRHENLEWYAEKMEHQWTEQVVIPYLERHYPKECRAFRGWVGQRGGLSLPLGFFAGDPRRTGRDGMTWLVSTTAGALERWLEKLSRCASRTEAHLAFAWELHYSDKYDECLAVLNRILDRDPAHVSARECRADTLVHLERYDEALADADGVIRVALDSMGAWETRADVLEFRQDWTALREACQRWSAVPGVAPQKYRNCHRYRAIAQCALGDFVAMEESLAAYLALRRFKDPKGKEQHALFVRRVTFRRAKKPLPDDPLVRWT